MFLKYSLLTGFFRSKDDPVGPITTAPSGRKYYRHSSDMGSVMMFNDGVDRRVIILDAYYRRGGLAFGPANFLVPGLYNITNGVVNRNNNHYLYGSAAPSFQASASMTDATINYLWASVQDRNTSRYNCDCYMAYASRGFPAVQYARNIIINGRGCDVPNVNIAMRMACDCEIIDSMDKTVASYPGRALGSRNPSNYWYIKDSSGDGGGNGWTSTQVDKDKVIYLDEMSYFYLGPWSKTQAMSHVTPVFEV